MSKEAPGNYMDDIWAYILLTAEQEDLIKDMKDDVSIEIPENKDGYAILHKCAVLCLVVSQCTNLQNVKEIERHTIRRFCTNMCCR